ncbi:MAG: hypothetical protein JRI98_10420 [Deltaproteobacteria bacterium]|nr:hypothetical protein [Deltaproteobacteria bacterium]
MHPLERVINSPEPLVLIGNASEDRFPGYSYDVYTRIGKKFYCLDMGGLPVSRGPTKGGKVYHAVAELPDDRGDLAVIWVHPKTASGAVDLAHEAGCKRVWFSFGACKVHTLMVKASGLYRRPPQTDPAAKRREQL